MLELNRIYNMDCTEGMKQMPDKAFELAIVDPPYGININMNQGRRKNDIKKHDKKEWDKHPPSILYWEELRRCSKDQIVWGANNFSWIPPHNGWVVWDKDITGDVPFSKAELAFNSTIQTVDLVRIRAQTGEETYHNKIHPTQKPVQLYKWLLRNYAKKGDKILDTHMGSGSSIIACHDMGFDYMAFEIDEDYYNAATKRIEAHKAQLRFEM